MVPSTLAGEISAWGNHLIWERSRTAFLCSRKVAAAQVLKCYDWAKAMRDEGRCVMLGAHSALEKDVLHFLLKGDQPVVLVLARGLKNRWEPTIAREVDRGRLLVVTPFPEKVKRVTRDTAAQRNRFLLAHAAQVVVGGLDPNGMLAAELDGYDRPVSYL